MDEQGLCHADLVVFRTISVWPPGDVVDALGPTLRDFYGAPLPPADVIAAEWGEIEERRPFLLDQFRHRVSTSPHVTVGAKALVDDAPDLLTAYRVVLGDKDVRQALRNGFEVGVGKAIDEAANQIDTGGLPAGEPAPEAARVVEADDDADEERLSTAEAPDLFRIPLSDLFREGGAEFSPILDSARTVEFQLRGVSHTTLIGELPDALEDGAREEEVLAIFKGLLGTSDRFTILMLYAASAAGRIQVTEALRGHLRVFAIRALMGANAYESAYEEARALAEDDDLLRLLPEGEHERLQRVIARSAARSGRADEAVERYTSIFAQHPGDDDAFRELLSTAFASDEELTRTLCEAALQGEANLKTNGWLFIADLLRGMGKHGEAMGIVRRLSRPPSPPMDTFVGLANIGLSQGNETIWRSAIERYFEIQRLPVRWIDSNELPPFSFVSDGIHPIADHPLVSIVMTSYNAADTLGASVRSVLGQSCANLELIIVDDDSSDNTRDLILELADSDDRIKHIFRTENNGTYVAKNEGIGLASGEFITFHDSDDWMHPRRLEGHLNRTVGGIRCTTSMWLRMDETGTAIIRRGGPFTHLNPASTFYHRSVFEAVGRFDAVRTGADAELLARVRAWFGPGAIRNIPSCLGLGLHHEMSLTQSGAAAFDEYRYSPVRLKYTESWVRWHLLRLANGGRLRMDGSARPFAIPEEIRP